MEKDTFEKIIDNAKGMKLTDSERIRLFSDVDSFIKKNPIVTHAGSSRVRDDIRWTSFIFGSASRVTSFALVVVLVLGGGVSVAAGAALPGDILFPVKININEGVRAVFVTALDKADFEADRITSRLEELERLALTGRLTPKAEMQAVMTIDNHVRKADRSIQSLKLSGALDKVFDVSSSLESSLRTYESTLTDLRDTDETQAPEIDRVVDKVRATIEVSTQARVEAETLIVSSDKEDLLKHLAEKKLDAAKAAKVMIDAATTMGGATTEKVITEKTPVPRSSVPQGATMTSSADATTRSIEDLHSTLTDPGVLIMQGEEKLKSGQYKEAIEILNKANRSLQSGKASVKPDSDATN